MANPKNKSAQPSTSKGKGAKKHQKQPTQRTPMQRIQVMGPTGKLRMEWREWGA